MDKITAYRAALREITDWEPYLRANSNLPGPRGNLELVFAAAEEAAPVMIERLLANDPLRAPENTPEAFLAVCGTVALGRLLAESADEAEQARILARLRGLANDPRWRVREGVAMALQRLGDASVERLLAAIEDWAEGAPLEQRAAAAAICEPRLLRPPRHAAAALGLLDRITNRLQVSRARKSDAFQALRKGLGYCWSVAVAALPEEGKARFAAWADCPDPDVRWVLRENLKKNRLQKMDPAWTAAMKERIV